MSKLSSLNILQRICLEFLWSICWLLGHLPHFVQFYMLAPFIKFILYRLVRYRRKVILNNLSMTFPTFDEKEKEAVCRDFYTYLSEAIVSIFVLTNKRGAMRIMGMDEKHKIGIRGDLNELKQNVDGRNWIALTAHYGLWEYLLFWAEMSEQYVVAVYHRLRNVVFDELFKRLRSHRRVLTMSPKESLLFSIRNQGEYQGRSFVVGLIADQTPKKLPSSLWINFLGRETVFYDGGEKMALRAKLPVIYLHQKRTARGRYQIHQEEVWDGKEAISESEITRRYAKLLERDIKEIPYLWLWSHKRWKHVR